MITTRAYHGLTFTIAKADSERVCYVLLPEGLHSDGMTMIEESATKHSCTIVLITGMNWNADLTPWPAPGVFKREKPFEGKAEFFLKELLTDYFPGVEEAEGIRKPQRFLVGISLSGLFAVWSLFRTGAFRSVASISGSLWYDSLIEWFCSHELVNAATKVHLSLGDREKKSKNARMATVEDTTATIAHILGERGCEVDFKIVDGTHFSPIVPRLEMAFDAIL